MTDLQTAQHIDAQLPNPYTKGQWYPVTSPEGTTLQGRRTTGKGRNARRSYLHVRKQVTQMVNGEAMGRTWLAWRVSLQTGEWQELN